MITYYTEGILTH